VSRLAATKPVHRLIYLLCRRGWAPARRRAPAGLCAVIDGRRRDTRRVKAK